MVKISDYVILQWTSSTLLLYKSRLLKILVEIYFSCLLLNFDRKNAKNLVKFYARATLAEHGGKRLYIIEHNNKKVITLVHIGFQYETVSWSKQK